MLFPPDDTMLVARSDEFYDFWRRFTFHNDMDIESFQTRFQNVIPKSLKSWKKYLESKYKRSLEFYDHTPKSRRQTRNPIHISLPAKNCIPSKASTSFVFASCVCLALKEVFGYITFENNDQLVRGIYTYFSVFQSMTDFRVFTDWTGYFKINQNVRKYGYYRASRLAKQVTNLCKHCSQKNKELVKMLRNPDSRTWKCPNCGGNAPIVLHFSVTHLKRKKNEIDAKARDVVESIPIFYKEVEWIINYLTFHPIVLTALRTLFDKYALEAEKGILFATKRYFWGHYDKNKKSKRRWCPLRKDDIEKLESTSKFSP